MKPLSLEGGLPSCCLAERAFEKRKLLSLAASYLLRHFPSPQRFPVNEFNSETKPGNKWLSRTVHFQSSDLAAFCLWAVLTYSCQESKQSVRL